MKKVIKGSKGVHLQSPSQALNRPSYSPRPSSGSVVSKDTAEAKSQAQQIIQKAYSEAERIRIEAEAYRQRGYEEGKLQGAEDGKAELTEAILDLNRKTEEQFRHFEPELVKLSLKIAEKIIGRQMELDPALSVNIVSKALSSVRHQREIFLRVNPEDYEIIRVEKEKLLEQLSRAQDIDIRPDPQISRGGCLIESEVGTIEATLKKQLAAIEKILLGVPGEA